jgi:dTDP-4-amino-4,6-dideoxygalactose transaminase
MYYLLLPTMEQRDLLIARLKKQNIHCVFHYVPLHNSEMGKKVGRSSDNMRNTDKLSSRLVRLPFWLGLEEHQAKVIAAIMAVFQTQPGTHL